jgi:hypothetical protein
MQTPQHHALEFVAALVVLVVAAFIIELIGLRIWIAWLNRYHSSDKGCAEITRHSASRCRSVSPGCSARRRDVTSSCRIRPRGDGPTSESRRME